MTITHSKVSAVSDGADTSKIRPSDWNDEHVIADGYTLLRKKSVTLTDAQIRHLPNQAIEIVPAPGENKALLFYRGYIIENHTGGAPYTGVNDGSYIVLSITNDEHELSSYIVDDAGASLHAITGLFNSGATQVMDIFPYMIPNSSWGVLAESPLNSTVVNNKGWELYCDNGGDDFADGSSTNTMTVIVYYDVIDL